ncbi:tubulin polymerization-promoting family protein [bacterium]|nr:tubulin polymerization-promoting family protein [bacterium]
MAKASLSIVTLHAAKNVLIVPQKRVDWKTGPGIVQIRVRAGTLTLRNAKRHDEERSDTMNGAKFAKFCRDCNLQVGRLLDSTSVDIIFSRVKPRGERRMTFEEFKDAVTMVAEMRGERFRDIADRVGRVCGPQQQGTTRAEYVKFADPSNFTGEHAANLGS